MHVCMYVDQITIIFHVTRPSPNHVHLPFPITTGNQTIKCNNATTLCFKKKFTLLVFTITKTDVDQF